MVISINLVDITLISRRLNYATFLYGKSLLGNAIGYKFQLIRLLSNYGYSTQDKRELFNIVDWIIKLPNDLQPHFADWIKSEQESPAMRYINTVERFAIKEGIEVGREEGMQIGLLTGQSNLLINMLQHRFGDLPADITDKVKNATLEQIQTWSINFVDAKTIDEVFA